MRKSELQPSKRLYSLQDASIYLGMCKNTIRKMLDEGKLPFIREGKRILVDIIDLNQWIDRSKEVTTF